MITTHVLDLARGRPAVGVVVTLELEERTGWREVGRGMTDVNGRLTTLTEERELTAGSYRLAFDIGAYFREQGIAAFFPVAHVTFHVRDGEEHHHVPLLLSPFGYTTYRGS